MLFGVLGCAAAPLYLAAAASTPAGSGSYQTTGTGPLLLSGMPMGTKGFYIGWYWTVALVAGYLLTVWWYWRAVPGPVHLRPGLITGVVCLTVLEAPCSSPVRTAARWLVLVPWSPIGDGLANPGFLIIAIGLWCWPGPAHPGLGVSTHV